MKNPTGESRPEYGPGDDLEMMLHPDAWPVWPRLPMKKSVKGNWPEYGFLYEKFMTDQFAFVLDKTIFEKSEPGDKIQEFEKDSNLRESFQKLLDAGWVVD